MKLVYFAWVRERIGKAEEVVDLPAGLDTVAGLLRWLRGRGEEYAYAFEGDGVVRVAIDRVHAKSTAPLTGASEIAFFPPMTGG